MSSPTVNTMNEVTLESRTEQIKQFALGAGANVVGVADPRAWEEHVPEGHRPYDILPGARSVVVVGSRGPTAGAWRSPNHRLMEVNGYDFRNDAAIQTEAAVRHVDNIWLDGFKRFIAKSPPVQNTSGEIFCDGI